MPENNIRNIVVHVILTSCHYFRILHLFRDLELFSKLKINLINY